MTCAKTMKIITRDFNQISVNTYNCCAQAYEQRFMDITPYRLNVDEFCTYFLTEKPNILDLGCGPGNFSSYFYNTKGYKKITGLDLSPEMIRLAKENVPQATFILADIRKLNYQDSTFHGIFASFCIPFLSYNETNDLIANVSNMLKPDGLLYLSCMEGCQNGLEQTSFSGELAVYLYYYSEEFLASTLEEYGMQVLSFNKRNYKTPDGKYSTDIIIIAQKGN